MVVTEGCHSSAYGFRCSLSPIIAHLEIIANGAIRSFSWNEKQLKAAPRRFAVWTYATQTTGRYLGERCLVVYFAIHHGDDGIRFVLFDVEEGVGHIEIEAGLSAVFIHRAVNHERQRVGIDGHLPLHLGDP